LNETGYIKVNVTPTNNPIYSDNLGEYGITIPTYTDASGTPVMVIKTSESVECKGAFSNGNNELILAKIKSKLTNTDVLFANEYDYFVVDKNDPFIMQGNIDNAVTVDDIKNIVRILFSNNNIYLYRLNYTIDKSISYLARFNNQFQYFHEAFCIFIYLENEYPNVREKMSSLATRLTYILMTYDKIAYCAFQKVNNSSIDDILYYFGFFVVLCTGTLDDLAWMLNDLYNLNLNKRDIVLKKYNNNEGKLRKYLKTKNIDLYNTLNDNNVCNLIQVFYPLRDSIQHRNYIIGYTIHGVESKNMIYLGNESYEMLSALGQKARKVQFNNSTGNERTEYSIEAQELLDFMYNTLKNIISQVYLHINWQSYKAKLTDKDKKEVDKSVERFTKNYGMPFDVYEKPMYL
jgi:hypothetical protein